MKCGIIWFALWKFCIKECVAQISKKCISENWTLVSDVLISFLCAVIGEDSPASRCQNLIRTEVIWMQRRQSLLVDPNWTTFRTVEFSGDEARSFVRTPVVHISGDSHVLSHQRSFKRTEKIIMGPLLVTNVAHNGDSTIVVCKMRSFDRKHKPRQTDWLMLSYWLGKRRIGRTLA